MTDIHDITGPVQINFFADNFVFYLVLLIIVTICSYWLYIYNKPKEQQRIVSVNKKPFLERINTLSVDLDSFFESLSYIVRLYYSKRQILINAENMSLQEIKEHIKDQLLISFLEELSLYEFWGVLADHLVRIELKRKAKEIINRR